MTQEINKASIVITTKDRRDDLRQALASSFAQSVPVEVIVVDDGSTDGTAELVRQEFPATRLQISEVSRGYIVARNHAARMASTPFIFSIDDDAVFSTPRVVEQTLTEFSDPRVGAVAIPYIEPNKSGELNQRAPDESAIFVTNDYIGTSHALRRETFLKLGGYRECLIHQGEEGDFCLRLLDAGYVTRLGCSDPIHHFESPKRDLRRMDVHGRRNDVLFAWHNVPMPYLPIHLAATSSNGLLSGIRLGRPWRMLRGTVAGYRACFARWRHRAPVGAAVYRLNRRLKKRGPIRLDELADLPGLPDQLR